MKTSLNAEIVNLVKARLDKGHQEYNQDVTLEDSRDWMDEALQEALDLSVYLCAEILRYKYIRKQLESSLDNVEE